MKESSERFFAPLTIAEIRNQLPALREKLGRFRTLSVQPNENGIYAASLSQHPTSLSGYQYAWLRDNVMVAFSRWECGDRETPFKTLQGLTKFLRTQTLRIEAIISKPERKEEIEHRPHVRFDALTLKEIDRPWAHAQNDALAYVVWFRFRLANEGGFDLANEERELYSLLPRYFAAIEYWKDADNGAWEEARKLNSSSVGAVRAALIEIKKYLRSRGTIPGLEERNLDDLAELGQRTLQAQLPFESPPARKTDSALLFLIYPLQTATDRDSHHLILSLVRARLLGAVGVRRYVGDSYFCQDYDEWFPPGRRSEDFSNRIELRDEYLQPGCEAQWCVFDPLLSTIYGALYLQTPTPQLLERQLYHLNRAIGQITEQGQCPELYYLRRGEFVPNEHTPLAWTQANLAIALHYLELVVDSASRTGTTV